MTAHSKKQGKQEAADAALRVLIGESEKTERMEGMSITEVNLLPKLGLCDSPAYPPPLSPAKKCFQNQL